MKNWTVGRRGFLKSMLGAGAAAGSGISLPLSSMAGGEYRNWARNIRFTPREIARPDSISDLKALVASATRIKVAGSRHSFNDIASTGDVWVQLRDLRPAPVIDRAAMTAELPASMTLNEANCLLEEHGLAFPSIGEIDGQTLAGLTATATHGTGLDWGTLSDAVQAVNLVDGKARYLRIDNGDLLASARTHLGALGALTSIRFQLGPSHRLLRRQRFLPIKEALDPAFLRANAHVQIFHFPFTDGVYVKTLNPTELPTRGVTAKGVDEVLMQNLVLDTLLKGAASSPDSVPSLMDMLVGQLGDAIDVGPSYRMMTSIRTMRYHELEMAFDLKHALAALLEVKNVIARLASPSRPEESRYYAHLPVTLRVVGGKRGNFLSPTLGRDTAYLSVTSHTHFEGAETYFREVEKALGAKFGARPHWGKHFYSSPKGLYPNLPYFQAARAQLDPHGKFVNPFLLRAIV